MAWQWVFRHYVSARRVDEIEAVYDGKSLEAQAAFDNAVRFLAQRPVHDWKYPHTEKLTGECDGLVEIRFKADEVQQRPLGYFGPDRGQFTILIWAIEKNDRFEPRRACSIAQKRRGEVDADPEFFSRIYDVE